MIKNKGLLVIDPQDAFIGRSPLTQAAGYRLCDLLDEALFSSTAVTRFRNAPDSPHQTILGWKKMTTLEECQLWKPIQERVLEGQIVDKHTYTSATPEVLNALHQGDTVFLAGLDTDCCVLTTAVDLFQRSIRPIVLADFCSSSGGEEAHEAGLQCLQRLIGPKNIVRDTGTAAQLRERLERENLLPAVTEQGKDGGPIERANVLEAHYQTTSLDVVLRNIWHDLKLGAADSQHRFHTVTLATSGTHARPTQRSVLLRGCSPERSTLTFYTDLRTKKIQDIQANPVVSLCFYDQTSGVQIIADGRARLCHNDQSSQRVIAGLPSRELPRYLAEEAPGTPQPLPTAGLPRDLRLAALTDEYRGRASRNFALVEVTVESIDWLIVQEESCLRARFLSDGTNWQGTWVTP